MRTEDNSLISVCYTCGDRDCVEVTKETVVADPQIWEGSFIGQGSLEDGFGVTLYTDRVYATPALEMPIGTTAYVKVFWDHPISGVKFCIDKCSYSCGTFDGTVDIIKVSNDTHTRKSSNTLSVIFKISLFS